MKKQRNSKQRRLILDAVTSRNDHPTADRIYMDVRSKENTISRGTVYRNLGILSENGEIAAVKLPSADRFDHRTDPHYHVICKSCGRVYDAPVNYNEQYDRQIERDTGFQIDRHSIIFEGLCPECIKR